MSTLMLSAFLRCGGAYQLPGSVTRGPWRAGQVVVSWVKHLWPDWHRASADAPVLLVQVYNGQFN